MSELADQAAEYHAEAERLRKAGDRDAALIRQRRAVALWREAGDPAQLAHAVRHIADMLVEAGRAAEASEPIAEMIALYARLRDAPPLDVANALRSAAVHAEAIGDGDTAEGFWLKARQRYAALDDMFEELTGQPGNPGVAEADRRINALRG
jgi:tetratricopeptide (TPR) repeat protein